MSRDEQHVLSGGADSVLVIYRDNTEQVQQVQLDEQKKQVRILGGVFCW